MAATDTQSGPAVLRLKTAGPLFAFYEVGCAGCYARAMACA